MADLRITAEQRTERLSNAETVRLGRLLTRRLGAQHVYYPDDSPTVVIGVRGYAEALPTGVADSVRDIIGPFTEDVHPDL